MSEIDQASRDRELADAGWRFVEAVGMADGLGGSDSEDSESRVPEFAQAVRDLVSEVICGPLARDNSPQVDSMSQAEIVSAARQIVDDNK